MSGSEWQIIAFSWHAPTAGGRAMGIAVWIGVALLSLTLLVMMRTRWGQVQPLSKCVVLSVFAHVLLFLYAYGTHLLEERPPLAADPAIQLAFVTTDAPPVDSESSQHNQANDERPWEQLPAGDVVTPAPDVAQRLVVEPVIVPTAQPASTWTPQERLVPEMPLHHELADRHAVMPPDVPHATPLHSAIQPTPLPDESATATHQATGAVPPEPERPERLPVAAVVAEPTETPQARLPSELAAAGSTMQQLAAIEPRSEAADALAAPLDQLAQSENRDASKVDSTGRVTPTAQPSRQRNLVPLPPRSDTPEADTPTTPPRIVAVALGSAARRLGDGQSMPELYRLRTLPRRHDLTLALGNSAKGAAAVDAALAWLASAQDADGRWNASRWGAGVEMRVAGHDREGAGANADTGITGLAVLAFLANGQTHLEGTNRKNVQRGLEFLMRSQAADGNLAGPAELYARMYCHGMASLALSEALGMTGDTRLTPFVERAVEFIVRSQHSTTGGWRYQPGDQGDMSQFGWQVMALKSASLAGVAIPHKTREGMLHFLQRCEHGRHGGLSCYKPGSPPSRSMTAEALACRFFLDLRPDEELLREASEYLMGELPQPGQPNLYYWYYGTLALFQVQGEPWSRWNEAMQRQLLSLQRTDGQLAGSWDPNSVWGCYGGRVYSTALATLCLEVYYRYLPLTAAGSSGQHP